MKWKISYSPEAENDLDEIYSYIAYDLKAPKTAAHKVERIMSEIEKLDNMPMKFKVYDFEPWQSQQLRCFSVESYIVFYLISEETQDVYITRIIYGRRDLNEQLENSDDL
ncbi:MAG: type II toxin-antitoxin system RelE/ParE family toxin [Oscillospiraceae bacterium]|nr:type II toxin-antitoxin system RelE/ParE family toxin [Oscillospiraceae bacterium]